MNVQTTAHQIELTDAIREHIDKRLTAALNQHEQRVSSVELRLEDLNAQKGGVDKLCRVTVNLKPRGTVVVEERGADLYLTISHAADRVKAVVGRKLDRREKKRRGVGR